MIRTRHLFRSSVLVIILFGLGKLTGLVRTQLVGRAFGTGAAFDAFTAANQLPEVFVTLLAGGALAAAFIPVYSSYLTDQKQRHALRVANSTLTLVLLVLTLVSMLGAVSASWLTSELLVPSFSPEQQALTADLMRIILLQTTLFGISSVLSSILNAHQHFALPAFAPIMLDVGYLLGLYLIVPALGIRGLAWGTVIGGVLHIAVQLPALRRYRFRFRFMLALRSAGVKEILRLMWPRIITLGAIQFADLFIIRLTSGLPSGSTSAYFYGYYVQQLPETLLGTAIAIVVFPSMAEAFNRGDLEGLKDLAVRALQIIWTLTIPAAVGLLLLGQPTIALVFQRGAFDAASTRIVYQIVVFFSLRVISEASLEIVARLLYAQHDTRTPMFAYIGWLLLNVTLMYLLVDKMGAGGLALSSTVAFTALSVALFLINRRRLGPLHERRLLATAGRSLVGSIVMGVVIIALQRWIQLPLLLVPLAGGLGLLVYILVLLLLRSPEMASLRAIWRQLT